MLSAQEVEDQRHHRCQRLGPQAGPGLLLCDARPGGVRPDESVWMRIRAGEGARIGAWKNQLPEWTYPGPICPTISLRVDREPQGVGALVGSPKPVISQSVGHGRLSSRTFWGVKWRQGPGSFIGRSLRLDPDGWLVRSEIDTYSNESPAAEGDRRVTSHLVATRQGYGICGKLLRTFQQLLCAAAHKI